MTCSLSVGSYAFADNPIQLEVAGSTMATYQVRISGALLFRGISSGDFTVNIAEVLRGRFTNYNSWVSSASGYPYLLTPYRTTDHVLPVTVSVTDSDGTSWSGSFSAVRGGIPKRLFRSMKEQNTTFFDQKDVLAGNNFFTIRSNGWRINLKETELSEPLFFFMPTDGTGTIVIKPFNSNESLTLSGTAGNLYALDIAAVRAYFWDECDILCNHFCIYNQYTSSGTQTLTMASRILIEEADPSEERYQVRFRSSLGCMEVLELAGKASMSVEEHDDNESKVALEYDDVTDSYNEIRERTSMVETISVPSGIKRTPEVLMLRDMLNSDEVYFVADDEEWKVIPSCEDLNVPLLPTEPQNYNIRFKMTEGEECTGFCFINGNFVKPRLFAAQYAAQFE